MSDEKLTQDLAEIIETGKNSYQATAKDALRGIEMAFKLKGKFPARKEHLIERRDLRLELRGMSDKELRERFETIQESLKDYFEATNQPGTHPD